VPNIAELSTPCLLIDADVLDRNVATMASVLPGDRLRPHVKAHKCVALAAVQYAAGHRTFTCATPREIIGMARAGVGDDLLLANETVDASRLQSIGALDVPVTIAIDSDATLDAASAAGIRRCLIDVNVGLPRCGVAPERAGALADRARAKGLDVRGVMGYEGHLMMVTGHDERLAAVARSMEMLRRAHADVGGEIVSAGGTGTYDLHGNTGVTEVQAGSYALMDTQYGTLGLPFEQALHVLGTVISVCSEWAVADVGLKALGMDHGNPSMIGADVWLCADEHVTFSPTAPVAVGDRVHVVPAHVDPTMSMHEAAWITRGGEVIDRWPIDLRGW
jgi:D-serine deaminase-like pyridoxal phosphate-dependent protein